MKVRIARQTGNKIMLKAEWQHQEKMVEDEEN